MSINITGTPRAILNGVVDRSGSIVDPTLSAISGFNPILYLLTQRGPEGTHDLDAVGSVNTYGTESFRAGSPYYNHQTVLANEIIPFAPAHIHRIRLPGAARSVIRVSAELATCTVPTYLHDALGNVITERNIDGVHVPVIDGYTVGSRIILHFGTNIYPPEHRGIGKGIIIENFRPGNTLAKVDLPNLPTSYLSYTVDFTDVTLSNDPINPDPLSGFTTQDIMGSIDTPAPVIDLETIRFHGTTLIPLFETEVAYFGGVGDQMALVVDDLITTGSNTSTMWDIKNFVYQLRLIEKMSGGSTVIKNTDDGDRVTAFTLGSVAYSERTHVDYNFKSVISRKYNSNLGNSFTYDSNIINLQRMLVEGYELTDGTVVDGELSYGNDGLLSLGVINLLGGLNANGKPYKTLRLQDSYSFGGNTLGGTNPIYGNDGSDGLVYDTAGRPDHLANLRLFDEEVRRQLDNFGDLDDPLLDIARYPITSLVDTGFSQETKDAMITAYNKRPDLYAILATFRVADYSEPEALPPPDARISVMTVLRPNATAYVDNPSAIKAQYLTYGIVKSANNLHTDVNITIDPNIPVNELFDATSNFRNVLIGLGIANPEYLYIDLNTTPTPATYVLGECVTLDELSDTEVTRKYNLAEVRNDFSYILGNQHVDVKPYGLNKTGGIQSDGTQLVAQYKLTQVLNYDGLESPEQTNYKETTSTVNIQITYKRTFVSDEHVVVMGATDFDTSTYSGKVGDITFNDLTPVQLVAFLESKNIEAMFVPVGQL